MKFWEYYYTNMHKIREDAPYQFLLIDPKTAYLRIPRFRDKDHFMSLYKKIDTYKQGSKKTLDIMIIDVRGNGGGCSCC